MYAETATRTQEAFTTRLDGKHGAAGDPKRTCSSARTRHWWRMFWVLVSAASGAGISFPVTGKKAWIPECVAYQR